MAKSKAKEAKKAKVTGPRRAAAKAIRGLSLHIGVNSVSAKHYAG